MMEERLEAGYVRAFHEGSENNRLHNNHIHISPNGDVTSVRPETARPQVRFAPFPESVHGHKDHESATSSLDEPTNEGTLVTTRSQLTAAARLHDSNVPDNAISNLNELTNQSSLIRTRSQPTSAARLPVSKVHDNGTSRWDALTNLSTDVEPRCQLKHPHRVRSTSAVHRPIEVGICNGLDTLDKGYDSLNKPKRMRSTSDADTRAAFKQMACCPEAVMDHEHLVTAVRVESNAAVVLDGCPAGLPRKHDHIVTVLCLPEKDVNPDSKMKRKAPALTFFHLPPPTAGTPSTVVGHVCPAGTAGIHDHLLTAVCALGDSALALTRTEVWAAQQSQLPPDKYRIESGRDRTHDIEIWSDEKRMQAISPPSVSPPCYRNACDVLEEALEVPSSLPPSYSTDALMDGVPAPKAQDGHQGGETMRSGHSKWFHRRHKGDNDSNHRQATVTPSADIPAGSASRTISTSGGCWKSLFTCFTGRS
ncbi:hypothetical protein CALCODRAFT_508713 [Calocera cornea HHB12733]|uniref:Uncharacterized protein n=1 Tax=Calocera cornea HHB12733 TaxID=1353952 RepID=A0A165G517_9BASI|nr:hypothetical protein CALCODRAFT_508713 [Calocera cornea HHB12733]